MTIFGWDMSHYDAVGIGNAVGEGIQFITHKAGGDGNDAELAPWWNGVRGMGPEVLLGAYWVLYPNNAAGRADAFIARLDSQCPTWRDAPFILQVDCEKWNGDPSTVPGRADIEAFCDRLVQRCPKLRPIVYAPKWVYGDSLAGLSYPLWASAYVSGAGGFRALYPGDNSSKWGAYSGQTPAILQYSSSAVIGGQTTCDANAYRGTLAELTALVAPGWEQDMIEDKDIARMFGLDGTVPTPSNASDYEQNPRRSAGQSLQNIEFHVRDTKAILGTMNVTVTALLRALTAKDSVDEKALAAELAPAVAAAVLANLPAGADQVTVEELTAAIRALIIPVP